MHTVNERGDIGDLEATAAVLVERLRVNAEG